jgi:hypothetical protein
VSSRPTRSLTLAGRRPPRNPILDPLSSSPRAPGKVPAEPGRRPRLLQPSLAQFGKHGCRIGAPAVLLVEVQLGRRLVINNAVISHDVRTAEPFHAHHQFCPATGTRRRRRAFAPCSNASELKLVRSRPPGNGRDVLKRLSAGVKGFDTWPFEFVTLKCRSRQRESYWDGGLSWCGGS